MKILCITFALVSLTYSAPSQYYIYTPTATQFIKLQPQFVQTTSELRFQDGKQILYYYPTAPITPFTTLGTSYFTRPYQVIALKDEGGQGGQQGGFDWVGFFQNWFQGGGSGESGAESGAAPAAESGASSESMKKFDLEKEMMKMSPEKRKEFEQRFLVVNSPYFNGLATLNEAPTPVFALQPLAIAERSKEPAIVTETIIKPKLTEPLLVVEPIVTVKQARSIEGQEVAIPAEIAAAPLVPEAAPVVAPVASSEKKIHPETMEIMEMIEEKVMEEKREEMKEEMKEEMMMMKDEMMKDEKLKDEMMKDEMLKDEIKPAMMEEKKPEAKSADDDVQSIAQAKPLALAVSGKDGLAIAAPQSTAVVGDGGIASAEPQAIAVSADLGEEGIKAT